MKESTSSNMAIRLLTLLLLALFVLPNINAKKAKFSDSPADMARAEQAIQWQDNGEHQAALDVFNELCEKYPDEPLLQYEKGVCLFSLQKYDEAKQIYEKAVKRKDATMLDFTMLGNCYDMLGDPNKAIEVYNDGFKKFPTKALFLTEIGNVLNRNKQYALALKFYEMGMLLEPNQPNDYFRAANLEFDSEEPVWGLIYAETEILLDPKQPARREVMANGMAQCYKNRLSLVGDTITVKLVSTPVPIDNPSEFVPTVASLLELCFGSAMAEMNSNKIPFDMTSFESVTTLRRLVVESYFESISSVFGDRMYLLEFQKKVIDAGHWEAYNWYIFSDTYEFDCEKWRLAHPEAVDAFINWYNDGNVFLLDDDKSVCRLYFEPQEDTN